MPAEFSKPSDLPDYLQEDDLSQECRELIATLPDERGWVANRLHRYQGFWHTTRQMQGVLNCQNHFQAHDSDIILITSPKSGTTWLKALTFAIQNRKTYYPNPNPEPAQTHLPHHPLLTTNPHVLVPFLELDLYLHKIRPDLSLFSSPRLFSSHLPYVSLPESMKWSECKIVYLCRNPKDIFVSIWHFMCNVVLQHLLGFHSLEDFCEEFCQGVIIFRPIWDHMLGYYKESLERPWKILLLRFEELKNDPIRTLKQLADFIGYGFSPKEENGGVEENILKLCSFENLSSLELNRTESGWFGIENKVYFRRGEVGDWKNLLTVDMVKRFNIFIQEQLEKHSFKF